MTVTAKVKKRMIDNGRLVHAIVQGESNATTIVFRIEGEADLVASESLYLYLLYKRPNDQTVQLPILLDYTIEDGVIVASFTPGAYFTAQDGVVEISIIATESTAELGGSGEVTNTLLWSSFPAWLIVAPSQLADSSTIIEENVFTQYLAQLEALNTDAEGFASDAEEYAKGTRSDGEPVTHGSDNAKYYKNLAKDWAMKTGGPVEGVEMSAKVYAASSQSYATESQQWANKMDGKVLGTDYSSKYYASDAKSSAQSAGASADIVAAHATAIDAIGDDLTNIDAVAADILDDDSAIDAVAANITNVNSVAANETNINAVNSNKTNIDAVAGVASNVTTVAGIASDVTAVAGISSDVEAVADIDDDVSDVASIKTDVSAVAAVASDVSAVADDLTNIDAVNSNKTNIDTVAGISSDVSAVAAIDDEIQAVEDALQDISDVATDLNDEDSAIKAVASDMTGVSAVAADLANIDAVADDLTNIDNAVNYALEAEGYANGTQNGTPVSSGSPYYHNNAKYWADAVPALQAKTDSLQKQIDNITEAEDLLSEVDYANGETAIPANVSEYAEVSVLKGVGRVENQMIPTAETHQQVTSSDTSWHFTSPDNYNLPLVNGHKYLFIATGTVMPTWGLRENGGSQLQPSVNANNLFDCSETGTYGLRYKGDGQSTYDCYIYFKDLTLYFNGSIPSNAQTIADIQKNYPDLLIPSDYGTEVVFPTYTAVKSVGVNIWNEEAQVGNIDFDNTGGDIADSTRLRSGYIPCLPSAVYYCKCPVTDIRIGFYDVNKNYLGSSTKVDNAGNASFTSASGAYFMRFRLASSYGTTYKNDIQICLNSYADKTTYHPHQTDTLSLPTPVTPKGAGSVAEEYYPESGEVTHPIGTIVYDGSDDENWVKATGNFFYISLNNLVKAGSEGYANRLLCDKLIPVINDSSTDFRQGTKVITGYRDSGNLYPNQNWLYVRIDDTITSASALKTWLASNPITVYYELAQANPSTFVTPILDPYVKVEPNGTIETVQSQTPKVDGAMTVTYTNKVSA